MAELSESREPRELVPGSPEGVDDSIASLRKLSAHFQTISEDLGRAKTSGWSGTASAAFRATFTPETQKWNTVSDALARAADSLSKHAEALRDAQQKAAESITLWERGEAATQESLNKQNAATTETDLLGGTPAAHSSGGHSLHPLSDPGEQYRNNARKLLSQARRELKDSGARVSSEISSRETRKNSQDALKRITDTVTGAAGSNTKLTASGPDATATATGPSSGGSLGQLQASANLANASVEHTAGNDFLRTATKAQASIGAEATGIASATNEGLSGRAEASAGAKASAQGHQDLGPVGGTGAVSGFAGARAGAGVQVGPKEFNASADAFAGARGTAKGGADLGGIGVNATAEGWAGPGAEAKAKLGKEEDGKWHVGTDAGLSPLVGGKLGVEFTVDPAKVERTAHEASDAVGNLPSTVGHSVGSAERTISGWIY